MLGHLRSIFIAVVTICKFLYSSLSICTKTSRILLTLPTYIRLTMPWIWFSVYSIVSIVTMWVIARIVAQKANHIGARA